MKEIIIETPDECGEKCICFEKTESDGYETYYICNAFGHVLSTFERCDECRCNLNILTKMRRDIDNGQL